MPAGARRRSRRKRGWPGTHKSNSTTTGGVRSNRLLGRSTTIPSLPCIRTDDADDRLPRTSFGRVEGGDGIVEGGDGADVRAQPSVPHSLNDLAQLGAI